MVHRRLVVPVLVASMWFAACKKDPPPPVEPAGPSQEELDARARADSIARAQEEAARIERERQAEMERQREAAVRAARETLEEMVFFDYDESAIRADAERVLRSKVEILRASPPVQLRITGHADERGSTEYNLALGQRRAQSVRDYFANFGLDVSRFSITSRGEQDPLNPASNEAAWARNRRAEFAITAGADAINPGG